MKQPILAIVGSAPNALDDLYGFLESLLPLPDRNVDVMAIGLDAVKRIKGSVRYITTNHPEDIPAIVAEMHRIGCGDYQLICHLPGHQVDIVEPYRPPLGRSGSSAMTGTLAALRMGYDRIVLCGCPLTGNAPEGNPYEAFRLGWEDRKEELLGKVRSVSGWTRELLGAPTEDWLNG